MEQTDNYKQQAQYWENYRLIDRTVKACVHLEDKSDTSFWDKLLQKYRPGKYHYISYSFSKNNRRTTGCEQCLRFSPYLSDSFFVCIDSDYRHLLGQKNLDTSHYILQTYTYSWENHYCQASNLQRRTNQAGAMEFDFNQFLKEYSKTVYEPLLILINSRKNNDGEITDKDFNQCLISQCTAKEMENNGEGVVCKIDYNLKNLLARHKSYVEEIDLSSLKANYAGIGLYESNAYLHIRGHNIFDLIAYIGKMLCKRSRIDFVESVLTSHLPNEEYWEMEKLSEDIRHLGEH